MRQVDLISAELGWGAGRHEAALGPKALREQGLLTAIQNQVQDVRHQLISADLTYGPGVQLTYADRLSLIEKFDADLAHALMDSIAQNRFPVVIGGDHAIAMGTWSGIICALGALQNFGLIWLDAHMDAHTPQTTPSFNIHGMPLAALLGYGEPRLVDLAAKGPKLNPQHVVLIGVRSFEEGEAQLLERLNVKIVKIDEVKERGLKRVFQEAIHYVSSQTKAFGLSIDVDVFDPTQAPGTGTPVQGGLSEKEVLTCLKGLFHHPKFAGLEIAEYDPTRDVSYQTANLVKHLLLSVLSDKKKAVR